MAEIEFKRRGTPLWVVLLALILIALAVWLFVRRSSDATPTPAPATPTTPAPATTTPPPTGATPAPAPAAAAAPLAVYSAFVDSTASVSGAEVTRYVAEGLRRLADAMQQATPGNGVQINLVRAMADSLRLPDIAPRRQADMAQAAFFAAGYALNRGNAAGDVSTAASQVQLDRTLQQQVPQIRNVFVKARDAMKGGAPNAPAGAPVPKR